MNMIKCQNTDWKGKPCSRAAKIAVWRIIRKTNGWKYNKVGERTTRRFRGVKELILICEECRYEDDVEEKVQIAEDKKRVRPNRYKPKTGTKTRTKTQKVEDKDWEYFNND